MRRAIGLMLLSAICCTTSWQVKADDVLRIMLEEPVAGEIHGGVGNLRGWAVATDGIDKIEIMIDGEYAFDAPYGGARGDVGGAFPDVANASQSGFSLAYAYSNLSPGSHTISAVAHTLKGKTLTSSATFEAVRFKQSFISGANAVDLAATSCTVDGDEISASNALIGGDSYDMVLGWRTAEQGFEIIKIVEQNQAGNGSTDSDSGPVEGVAAWQPPANVEWIQYNFNLIDTFCDDPNGFCAGWLEEAPPECKINYRLGDSSQDTQTRLDYEYCLDSMVFRPYLSLDIERVTAPLTSSQKDIATRLIQAGWNQVAVKPVEFRVASDIPPAIVDASTMGRSGCIWSAMILRWRSHLPMTSANSITPLKRGLTASPIREKPFAKWPTSIPARMASNNRHGDWILPCNHLSTILTQTKTTSTIRLSKSSLLIERSTLTNTFTCTRGRIRFTSGPTTIRLDGAPPVGLKKGRRFILSN